jgi:hypothetical protein
VFFLVVESRPKGKSVEGGVVRVKGEGGGGKFEPRRLCACMEIP